VTMQAIAWRIDTTLHLSDFSKSAILRVHARAGHGRPRSQVGEPVP
jgi:hypothetical protein